MLSIYINDASVGTVMFSSKVVSSQKYFSVDAVFEGESCYMFISCVVGLLSVILSFTGSFTVIIGIRYGFDSKRV